MSILRKLLGERISKAPEHSEEPKDRDAYIGDISKDVAERLNLERNDVHSVLQEVLLSITRYLRSGKKVIFRGFGTFFAKEFSPRGDIPKRRYPHFRAHKSFKRDLND